MATLLSEKIAALPANVRQFVASPDFSARLRDIEQFYGQPLGDVVARLVVGDIAVDALTDTLRDDPAIGDDLAQVVAADILTLLGPLQQFLATRGAPKGLRLPGSVSAIEEPQVVTIRQQWDAEHRAKADIVDVLYRAMQAQDRVTGLAALGSLLVRNDFRDILGDQRFAKALSEQYQRERMVADIQSLRLNPADPRHLKAFARWLLERQFHLKSSAAAQVAVDIVNAMNHAGGQRLAQWAYFDVASGEYHWV